MSPSWLALALEYLYKFWMEINYLMEKIYVCAAKDLRLG